MARVIYRQLDDYSRQLLAARVEEFGTAGAVAEELGVTRTAVSQALNGKYPANTDRLRTKIIERYAEGVLCPHLDRDLSPGECRTFRSRDLPTSPLSAVKHWQACRFCPHNPNARRIDP
jgi:Predicted transcriptional regulator